MYKDSFKKTLDKFQRPWYNEYRKTKERKFENER